MSQEGIHQITMSWYNEVVFEFEVKDKIKYVVTDSVANIKKAFFTLPGFENVSPVTVILKMKLKLKMRLKVNVPLKYFYYNLIWCFAHIFISENLHK